MKKENKIIMKFSLFTIIVLSVISPLNISFSIDLLPPLKRITPHTRSKSPVQSIGDLNVELNPIYIGSDADFLQMASQMNWDGEGTSENPFIIKNLTLGFSLRTR